MLIYPSTLNAHEYWVEPEAYQLDLDATLTANLRNGQDFKGSSFSYVTSNFKRFQIDTAKGSTQVKGRQGDIPALSTKTTEPGLQIISFWSTQDSIVFSNWPKFNKYLKYEGLEKFIQTHLDRELPKEDFKEVYTRNSKALVQVGPVRLEDQDKFTGMPFELVSQQNPYGKDTGLKLKFTLYWEGKPFPNSQVRVFEKPVVKEGVSEARTFTLQTDQKGVVTLDAVPGHDYLLNSVRLVARNGDLEKREPVWETWWAAMNFRFKK